MGSLVLDTGTAYRDCCWLSLALRGGFGDPRGGREMEKVGRRYLRQPCSKKILFLNFSPRDYCLLG